MGPITSYANSPRANQSREGRNPRGSLFFARKLMFDICHYRRNRLMFTKQSSIIKIQERSLCFLEESAACLKWQSAWLF